MHEVTKMEATTMSHSYIERVCTGNRVTETDTYLCELAVKYFTPIFQRQQITVSNKLEKFLTGMVCISI